MIINFHFNNGASGFHLDGEADDNGNPLVVYVRKQFRYWKNSKPTGVLSK